MPRSRQRRRPVETASEICRRRTKSPCPRTARGLCRLVVVIAIAAIAAALSVHSAFAYNRLPLIEHVASTFALRSADVRCPTMEEWVSDPIWGTSPNPQRAWGYTDMVNDFSVIHPLLCAGATAVTDTAVPAWQRATGVLVLVHESYHLRHWSGRYSEAKVECQAIRHFRQGAELLGASPELANDLLPYGLAAHGRMVRLYPNYRDRACKLPLWTLPMQP
jgi:hypothetical protein